METNDFYLTSFLPYPKFLPLAQENILVRLLNPGDEEFFRDLFRDATHQEVQVLKENFKNPWVVAQWFDQLNYRKVLPLAAVTLDSHRLIAISLLQRGEQATRDHGEIRLFVPKAYQELGLADILLDETLHLASRGNLLWLTAEVAENNHQVVNAFLSRGFSVKVRFENYLRYPNGVAHDVVLLMRPLTA